MYSMQSVVDVINKGGYKPLFMPPYLPFLNPIEECWSKIKKLTRRNLLDQTDILTLYIAEASSQFTVDDFKGWVRHAETYWDRCLYFISRLFQKKKKGRSKIFFVKVRKPSKMTEFSYISIIQDK